MKKRVLTISLALVVMTTGCVCGCQGKDSDNMGEIETRNIFSSADMMVYTYEEQKEVADIIAKVKVVDDLTAENSMFGNSDSDYASTCCSVREVEVLEVYKGNDLWKEGDIQKVQDLAAIQEENGKQYLYTFDEALPLEKDVRYLLFLSDGETMSGELGIISSHRGMINLDDRDKNVNAADIAEPAIREFCGEEETLK